MTAECVCVCVCAQARGLLQDPPEADVQLSGQIQDYQDDSEENGKRAYRCVRVCVMMQCVCV